MRGTDERQAAEAASSKTRSTRAAAEQVSGEPKPKPKPKPDPAVNLDLSGLTDIKPPRGYGRD